MARLPPASYFANRDPLSWTESDPSYDYLDPADRDEYDDFANERSRPHRNLPQTNVRITPSGSIRTSYQNRRTASSYSSQHSSESSRRQPTPPHETYSPEYDRAYGQYNYSPERSYQDSQGGSPPMRNDSPTRIPLTAGAAGAIYAGYEMNEPKATKLSRAPTSKWLEEERKSRAKRKYCIIGTIVFLLVAAVTGVTVYLVKFRHSGSSSSISGSSNGRNGFGATSSDLKPDPQLKRIFDGMDYTPLNAQYPGCGCIQANITADVAILSQLTSKIRLYGTDCDQATMVLDAIQSLKVDMTLFVGVWVDTNATTLNRQLNAMYDILKKYPTNLIDGIAVGNEVLFRQDKTQAELIDLITEVRTNITAMNLGKKLPVCTRYVTLITDLMLVTLAQIGHQHCLQLLIVWYSSS
jgi:hypothetical protein